jgi:hypothetical protein
MEKNAIAETKTPTINAKVGEDIKLNINPKKIRNVKVDEGYKEEEQKDTANVSKKLKENIVPDNPHQKLMQERMMIMQLHTLVEEKIGTKEFISDEEYDKLKTEILNNNLISYNGLSKNKKVEFLIKLYEDPKPSAEKSLNTILPYTDSITIFTSFMFYSPNGISDEKKIALLGRLAPDYKPQADEAIIQLLLSSNENVVTGCNINTLLSLRKKEYLGNKYFEQLSKQSGGRINKQQHKQLSKFSAKITTIVYAYYMEATLDAINVSIKNDTPIFENDLKLKGVRNDIKQKLLNKLKKENILDGNNKANKNLDNDKLKNSLSKIFDKSNQLKQELAKNEQKEITSDNNNENKNIDNDKLKNSLSKILEKSSQLKEELAK